MTNIKTLLESYSRNEEIDELSKAKKLVAEYLIELEIEFLDLEVSEAREKFLKLMMSTFVTRTIQLNENVVRLKTRELIRSMREYLGLDLKKTSNNNGAKVLRLNYQEEGGNRLKEAA